jgi:hypothetical protein
VPELTTSQQTLALAIVAGVALIAVLVTLWHSIRLRKMRREYMVLRGEGGEIDLLRAVGRTRKQLDALEQRVEGAVAKQEQAAAAGRFALQRFHMVRYDAFEDMGGRLSFSAALLDDHGDGVVITSINGRTETRTYAKPITNLRSEHNLSDEERAAIDGAVSGRDRTAAPATTSS